MPYYCNAIPVTLMMKMMIGARELLRMSAGTEKSKSESGRVMVIQI
jgi:hypothetical protein